MKRILALLLALLPLRAWGQVTITANVTDPNGVPYSNGNARAVLVDANGIDLTNVVVNVNGASIALPAQSKGLSATGAMSFTLYPNTQISYTSATSWKFSICSPPSTGGISPPQTCFSSTISISGATDISATLKSASVALVGSLSGGLKFPDGTVQYTANNSGTVSGQASGVIPLPSAANAITLQSHLDDGVTTSNVITSTEGFSTKVTPVRDIRAYGAKCDGSTDDTAALQAAITSLGATHGGKILIPGTSTVPCYFANMAAINWGSPNYVISLNVQGSGRAGTTTVLPGNVDMVADSGGPPAQFQSGGQVAQWTTPTSTFTLGTSVTAGSSQTVTPSSMTGIAANGYVTLVSTITCTITSTTVASSMVTVQLSGPCHIPAGYNIIVSGTTDSNTNGTQLVSLDDYVNNTISFHCTTCVNATGGTAAGPDEDRDESVLVTSTTSTTFTAYFSFAHASTDAGGVVGVVVEGANHHELRGISFGASGGVNVLIGGQVASCCGDAADNVILRDVSANTIGSGVTTSQGIEVENAIDVHMHHIVSTISDGSGAWGLRITNPPLIVGSTGGSNIITVDEQSVIRGGIKIDHPTILSDILFKDSISEETRRGVVTFQPNAGGTGTVYSVLLDNVLAQDNFHFYSIAETYYTNCLGIGSQITIKNNPSGLGAGTYNLVNANFDGNLIADASLVEANNIPASFNCRPPVISRMDGYSSDKTTRLTGLGPSFIPLSPQAVPTNPSSWSGTNCAVTTGQTFYDGSTNAGAISQTGGSSPKISLFTYTATSSVVGDYILYGGFEKSTSGNPTQGAIGIQNSFQQNLIFDGASASTNDSAFNAPYTFDGWHPVSALTQITAIGAGTSHPILYVDCTTGVTLAYPFMYYIPASLGYSQQQLMAWRAELNSGPVTSSMPAGSEGSIYPIALIPPSTTVTGTSGTALCSQGMQGTQKYASCYLNGYAQTGSAQTYLFPTAFSTTPVLLESGGSCGTYNPSSTATILTLPANAAMTAETCNIIVLGQ